MYWLGKPAYLSTKQTQNAGNPLSNGIFGRRDGVQDAAFKDGKSFTLLFSEVIGYDSFKDARGVWTCPMPGISSSLASCPPMLLPTTRFRFTNRILRKPIRYLSAVAQPIPQQWQHLGGRSQCPSGRCECLYG